MSARCPKCKAWLWSFNKAAHACPPMFIVHHEDSHGDDVDDGTAVHAVDAEDAASVWIEHHCDSEDHYSLLNDGDGWLLTVTEEATKKRTKVRICAEQSIDFTATAEDGDDADDDDDSAAEIVGGEP